MNLPGIPQLNRLIARLTLSSMARRVKNGKLTYLSPERLRNIERYLGEIQAMAVPGLCVETGVALGGSGILIASLMEPARTFRGYDVFGMIPPPSQKDDEKSRARYAKIASGEAKGIGGTGYYGYERDLYAKVAQSFSEFGQPVDGRRISLHRGLFEDTLQFEPGAKVAFAHIDCDWYEPVRLCLNRLYVVWSIGGYFVIDDYNDYGGCHRAVDEFLAQHDDVRIISFSSNLVLQRRPGA